MMQSDSIPMPVLERAALTLQRAFRKKLFLRKKPLDWADSMIVQAQAFGIPLYPCEPIKHSPPDLGKLRRWVELHGQPIRDEKLANVVYQQGIKKPAERQALANRMAHSITYISFEKFLQALQENIRELNVALFFERQKPYVLLQPYAGAEKSNMWVTGLAIPYLYAPPVAILGSSEADTDFSSRLSEYPEVHDVVIFDDAAYSGDQMARFSLYRLQDILSHPITCHIVVPFMTRKAIDTIFKRFSRSNQVTVKFYSHPIWTLKDLMPQNDQDYLNAFCLNYPALCRIATLTYFDHKIADDVSVAPMLDSQSQLEQAFCQYAGSRLGRIRRELLPHKIDSEGLEFHQRFIDPIITPYKSQEVRGIALNPIYSPFKINKDIATPESYTVVEAKDLSQSRGCFFLHQSGKGGSICLDRLSNEYFEINQEKFHYSKENKKITKLGI